MRRTALGLVFENLVDEPSAGLAAWARTTAGVVCLLLALQMLTGVLLAFYYVPSAESAHATVAYVEKVVGGGSWVRALHLYASQLLPLALALHLLQMLWRGSHRRKPFGWAASVLLLGLVMANAGTGYSLPWDARAFYSTRVAENVVAGLPLLGEGARAWLLGGAEVSTLTLSRFYALHAVVVPALLTAVVVARLLLFREPRNEDSVLDVAWARAQLARNSVVVALVFAALACYAWGSPAPLGPPHESAPPGYLPRPGAQFLWLFQLLKYLPKPAASALVLLGLPLLLLALALLPFTAARRRKLGLALVGSLLLLVAALTGVAHFEDSRDPRVKEQLARQAAREDEFRNSPFVPKSSRADASKPDATPVESVEAPPEAYQRNCAKCHGPRGEGKSIYPDLRGISARPGRTVEDLISIINDPAGHGLEARMPSFARKLTEDEKRAVAEWIVTLK
ncbi:MAG TPA: cytochrome b N-terminal domain-containing protein [Pyrinomonadaceae bacterium]|jgi:ubiquinol-cytochrome c reductase cytochrome b subunit|nr:cytochrome b N-terminal domain-containing protein [Pyrinomonadaceae bacterium]